MKTRLAWPKVVFEVLPLVAGAVLLGVAGARWLSGQLSGLTEAVVAAVGCLAFVALLAFSEARVWNVLVLGFFAVIGGAVLGAILPLAGASWRIMGLWSTLAAVGGGAAGAIIGERLNRLAKPLWLLAWVYLAGWLVLAVGEISGMQIEPWGLAGVVVFTGLVAVRAAGWRTVAQGGTSAAQAGGLLLLLANLLLAMGMWTGAFSA